MKALATRSPAPDLNVTAVEREESRWLVTVCSRERACCPLCGVQSSSRHSAYPRTLGDLSAQGIPVTVRVRVGRWRCRNERCDRRIFAERLPKVAGPFARQTNRLAGIIRLFGHSAGGRPSERLMVRLGMRVSDTTILRRVKQHARTRPNRAVIRVAAVDEWAWRKGTKFGTIVVDLERRGVVDLLADRVAARMAVWFKQHPEVEIINREFDEIRALFDAGSTVGEIAQKLGLGRRRVYRWVRRIDMPERNAMAPKPSTPAYFGAFLARSWAEGTTKVRHLFSDIRHRGYTCSYSHLARFLAPWRSSGAYLPTRRRQLRSRCV